MSHLDELIEKFGVTDDDVIRVLHEALKDAEGKVKQLERRLNQQVAELESQVETIQACNGRQYAMIQGLEAQIDRIKQFPAEWRGDYYVNYLSTHDCADELERVIKGEK